MRLQLSKLVCLSLGVLVASCASSEEKGDPSPPEATPSPSRANEAPPPEGTPAVVFLKPDGDEVKVWVEVARKPGELSKGLMYRRHMAWNRGMLFLFDREDQQSFWMKNTLIPLDMIFVRSDKSVLGVVHKAEPRTLTSRRVEGVSQYVVEVNGGWAKENGVDSGARVRFEDVD